MTARTAVTGFHTVCNLSISHSFLEGVQLIAQHFVFALQATSLPSEKPHRPSPPHAFAVDLCSPLPRDKLSGKGGVKMTILQSEIQSFKNRYSVHGDEPVTKTELAEFARRLADLLNELAK